MIISQISLAIQKFLKVYKTPRGPPAFLILLTLNNKTI